MRVATWNLGANSVRRELHDEAWHWLLDESGLNVDLAFVQEAVPPEWVRSQWHIHWARAWPTRSWGTGIIARRKFDLAPLEMSAPDTRFVMARLVAEGAEFTVVSIHAFTTMDHDWFTDRRHLRFVDRLQANFDAIREYCEERFIVGGDLNSGRIAEQTWPGQGHADFWAALDEAGFQSCPWSSSGEELTTFVHDQGPFRGQADHILLDAVSARGAATSVGTMPSRLSDHSPLLVELPA